MNFIGSGGLEFDDIARNFSTPEIKNIFCILVS